MRHLIILQNIYRIYLQVYKILIGEIKELNKWRNVFHVYGVERVNNIEVSSLQAEENL